MQKEKGIGISSKKNCRGKVESKQGVRVQTPDPRLVELVKVLARNAAERDYERIPSHSPTDDPLANPGKESDS